MTYGLVALFALLAFAANPAYYASAADDGDDSSQASAPLTPELIRALVQRVLENQQHNDQMLEHYEFSEHSYGTAKTGDQKDSTYFVVPTGDGLTRIELEHNGKPSDASSLDEQWETVAQSLLEESRVNQVSSKPSNEKESRRRRDRIEMIDAIGKAFIFHWGGRLTNDGHSYVRLTFEPNPAFHSSARFAVLYAHSHGTVWVDESSAQLARATAQLSDDVTWGGGLIAKLYKGGEFTYEQQSVDGAVWAPVRYSYDFEGRKFLFSMSLHERADYTNYRRVGAPAEELAVIRREHPRCCSK